jgi:hypothetical protein
MTDARSDPPEKAEDSLSETLDLAIRRISAAIVVAGAIIGLGIYGRPGPPRFDAFAVGDQIVRVDTKKGTIIACEGRQTCQLILQHGQRLARVHRTDALPAPAPAKPLPAAPAAEK